MENLAIKLFKEQKSHPHQFYYRFFFIQFQKILSVSFQRHSIGKARGDFSFSHKEIFSIFFIFLLQRHFHIHKIIFLSNLLFFIKMLGILFSWLYLFCLWYTFTFNFLLKFVLDGLLTFLIIFRDSSLIIFLWTDQTSLIDSLKLSKTIKI